MTRLSSVLSAHDLPLAELHSLKLDGLLVPLDEAFVPVDLPAGPAERARSLAPYCDKRLIVEQLSAAWVWGALASPPLRHELCASLGARSRSVHPPRLVVREVVISEGDWVELGGVRVTTPMRTAIDLARFSESFDAALVEQLLVLHGIEVAQLREQLRRRAHLPRKRIALDRLAVL